VVDESIGILVEAVGGIVVLFVDVPIAVSLDVTFVEVFPIEVVVVGVVDVGVVEFVKFVVGTVFSVAGIIVADVVMFVVNDSLVVLDTDIEFPKVMFCEEGTVDCISRIVDCV